MDDEAVTPSRKDVREDVRDLSTHTIELSPMVSKVPSITTEKHSVIEPPQLRAETKNCSLGDTNGPHAENDSFTASPPGSTSCSTATPPPPNLVHGGHPSDEIDSQDHHNHRNRNAKRSSSSSAVEDRLLSMGQVYRERQKEAKRRAAEERAAAEAEATRSWKERLPPHHLKPSSLSGRAPQSAEESIATRSQRSSERKCEQLLRLLEEEEAQSMTWRPQVCPKSAQLAENKKRKEQTAGLSAADVLMERKRKADLRLEALRRQEAEKYTFVPHVTARAHEVELPMTATERLYEHAKEREREFAALAQESDATWAGGVGGGVGPTGTSSSIISYSGSTHSTAAGTSNLFKPSISQRAARLTRKPGHSVHDDLYLFAKSRVEERAKAEYLDPACTFKPKVNTTSEHIAASMAESSTVRLLKPRAAPVNEDVVLSDKTENKKKSASSSAVRRRASSTLSLYDRQQLWLELKRKKIQEAQMLQEVEIESECTFHPSISVKGRMAYTAEPEQSVAAVGKMEVEENTGDLAYGEVFFSDRQEHPQTPAEAFFSRTRDATPRSVTGMSASSSSHTLHRTTDDRSKSATNRARRDAGRTVRSSAHASSCSPSSGGLRPRPVHTLNEEMYGVTPGKGTDKYSVAAEWEVTPDSVKCRGYSVALDNEEKAFFDILAELERPRTIAHLL